MEITFYLKESKAIVPTPIYARITLNSGAKFKYYLQDKILPKHWNQSEQKARKTLNGYSDMNDLLKTRKSRMESIHRGFISEHGNEANSEQLKKIFDVALRGLVDGATQQNTNIFLTYFDRFIEQTRTGVRLNEKGKPMSAGTVQVYMATKKTLKEFEENKRKTPLTFDDMDLEFYADFTDYLTTEKKQSTNTIGKNIKTIKTVLNDATERGINTNLKFKSKRFKRVSENTDSIYLNESELKELQILDLSNIPYLDRVRDLFLIGSLTGVRFSDWDKIRPEQVKGNLVEITAEKTGETIVIPIHHIVKAIFEKYGNNLPRRLSNQNTNLYLKELGKKLEGLQIQASKTMTKGGFEITQNFEKWQLLTTHTARRSFATNEYLAGTEIEIIKAITGHKTEKAFMRYIKVTQNQQAKRLQLIWDERNHKQTTFIAI